MSSLLLSKVIIILIVFVCCTTTNVVYGNINGTGSCEAGIAAIESTTTPNNTHIDYVGFPGATSVRPGGGVSFSEAQVQVTLDGSFLVSDYVRTFLPNFDLVWEVTSTLTPFKGIFFRVEKESDDFTNVGNDATILQNVLLCEAYPGVVGVTHLSNTGLTSAAGTLNFLTGGNVTIDVILVFDNDAESRYAFSSFPIFIQVLSEPPVDAPVDVPVDIPVTVPVEVPVEVPVTVPVEVPVEAPVTVPVEVPVAVPVDVPVDVPIAVPVEVPVAVPVDVPVAVPVDVPVDVPVAVPVDVPVDVPIAVPVDVPVTVPVDAPTEVPVEAPMEVPVAVPVDVPTEEPVDAPVDAPTDEPVEAPVDAPTEEPVESPVAAPVAKAGMGMEGKVKATKEKKAGKEKKNKRLR